MEVEEIDGDSERQRMRKGEKTGLHSNAGSPIFVEIIGDWRPSC